MKDTLITEVIQRMLSVLNNEQLRILQIVLQESLANRQVVENDHTECKVNQPEYLDLFIAAKRIEGCSDKTIEYYKSTITGALDTIGKTVPEITAEDLRAFLTNYKTERNVSKVTLDNVRRILSSFFLGSRMKITSSRVRCERSTK